MCISWILISKIFSTLCAPFVPTHVNLPGYATGDWWCVTTVSHIRVHVCVPVVAVEDTRTIVSRLVVWEVWKVPQQHWRWANQVITRKQSLKGSGPNNDRHMQEWTTGWYYIITDDPLMSLKTINYIHNATCSHCCNTLASTVGSFLGFQLHTMIAL